MISLNPDLIIKVRLLATKCRAKYRLPSFSHSYTENITIKIPEFIFQGLYITA